MLPDLINRVYTTKPKKRDDTFYPTTRVDVESELKAQSFIHPKRQQTMNVQRNIQTSQPAARYYDKKAIQQRIETRLMKGLGGDNFGNSNNNNPNQELNFQKVNQIMQNQNMNMKIVTDNISRNVLVYTPKLDGKERFKTNSYPDSLKQIDIKIQKYKKALEDAIKQQQQMEKESYFIEQQQQEIEQPVNEEENFDFLTGIGLHKNIEQVDEEEDQNQQQQQSVEENKDQNDNKPIINQDIQLNPYQLQFEQVRNAFSHIYEQYQNKISKAFIKKDQPKARVRRKNPKINITGKGNQLQKTGAPFDEVEHLMRIYNKEHVPCEPQILVPSFQSKKDNIANTVLAYLKDYKPLLSGNKQNIPKSIQGLLDVELEMLKTVEKEGTQTLQSQPLYEGSTGGISKPTLSSQNNFKSSAQSQSKRHSQNYNNNNFNNNNNFSNNNNNINSNNIVINDQNKLQNINNFQQQNQQQLQQQKSNQDINQIKQLSTKTATSQQLYNENNNNNQQNYNHYNHRKEYNQSMPIQQSQYVFPASLQNHSKIV